MNNIACGWRMARRGGGQPAIHGSSGPVCSDTGDGAAAIMDRTASAARVALEAARVLLCGPVGAAAWDHLCRPVAALRRAQTGS